MMMTIAYIIVIISLVVSIMGLIYSTWIDFIQRWLISHKRNKEIRHLEAREKYIEKQAKSDE